MTISIKDALQSQSKENKKQEEKEDKTNLETDTQQNQFTYDDLIAKWDTFANKLKKGKPRMYSTLKNNLPILKDNNIIEYTLNNTAQQDDFIKIIKHDLLTFLKTELQNNTIQIVTNIVEVKEVKRPYTSEEKFDYMNKKNPALSKLKQKFNLDFE